MLFAITLEDCAVQVQNGSGKKVELSKLAYDANAQMLLSFEPIPYNQQDDNNYTIQVGPSTSSEKLTGEQVSAHLSNELGFSGRITDI